MSIAIEELVRYHAGELTAEREAQVEEILFEDETTARRLDALVRLGEGIHALVRAGQLRGSLPAASVEQLTRAGLTIRSYRIEPGQTVPCTIALEDLVVVRLVGGFGEQAVSVVMDGTFEGMAAASERYDDVVVDRHAGEVVLVYSGERIRALPRSHFRYTVRCGEHVVGEYQMDHTPPS